MARLRIAVLTDSPCLLRAYFPRAEESRSSTRIPGRPPPGSSAWPGASALGWWDRSPWPGCASASGASNCRAVCGPEPKAAAVRPTTPRAHRRPRHRNRAAANGPSPSGSAAAAAQSSLVVALGGGYFTDTDRAQTVRVLNLVEHACDAGVPVALVGQGWDRWTTQTSNPGSSGPAASRPDRPAGRSPGTRVLERAGVAGERVMVTGDDAIELAYQARIDEIGSDIGLCLRVAGYAPVSPEWPTWWAERCGPQQQSASSPRAVDHRRVPLSGSAVDLAACSRRRRCDRTSSPVCAPIEVARRVHVAESS